jgi:hypothetical protein
MLCSLCVPLSNMGPTKNTPCHIQDPMHSADAQQFHWEGVVHLFLLTEFSTCAMFCRLVTIHREPIHRYLWYTCSTTHGTHPTMNLSRLTSFSCEKLNHCPPVLTGRLTTWYAILSCAVMLSNIPFYTSGTAMPSIQPQQCSLWVTVAHALYYVSWHQELLLTLKDNITRFDAAQLCILHSLFPATWFGFKQPPSGSEVPSYCVRAGQHMALHHLTSFRYTTWQNTIGLQNFIRRENV